MYLFSEVTRLFETTAGGGIFTPWSILGTFRGIGATSVLDRLEAHFWDVDGGPISFRTNLRVGWGVIFESTSTEISDLEKK